MFSNQDLELFAQKEISQDTINQQIDNFKSDFPPALLTAAANIGKGIVRFDEAELERLTALYDQKKSEYSILKFVPASGAASRMFKHLFEFKNSYSVELEESLFKDKGFNSVWNFFEKIEDFAFLSDLEAVLAKKGKSLQELIKNKAYVEILDALLQEDGLDYAALPKALLKFHKYDDENRFAIEEHFVEGAKYGSGTDGNVKLHFTVSPEHKPKFEETIEKLKAKFESRFGVTYDISLSIQKPSTDILAVDLENNPFRNDDGQIVFRPGGHGALIENLNELDQNIIFVKNIDNIVPDKLREPTYTYKKLIAGHLIELQSKTFEYLLQLDEKAISEERLKEIEAFAAKDLCVNLEKLPTDPYERKEALHKLLNRPIRICGMVKNEGEPGGGPFWVKNTEGQISLQIVEASQIDMNVPEQKEIVQNASHFNPVDLVCGVYDYRGNKFNLKDYVDPNTGFISEKSQNGKTLKAQELPGLWNGAMANWITIFVECPIITFNPVKTVNDLLREQHQ